MTQTEALRQKRRCDQKALTVTLNKRDVVLIRNNKFLGKRKLKDCWGDEVYTVCNQVDMDVPVYALKLTLLNRGNLQVAVRLFNVASTQISSEVQHQEMF